LRLGGPLANRFRIGWISGYHEMIVQRLYPDGNRSGCR
jgi:hypothetical protein